MKIIIGGYSGTGKTTLGRKLATEHNVPLLHTDDLLKLSRVRQFEQIAKWLDQDGYVIEGTSAGGGLREWKRLHPNQKPPVDKYIVLTKAKRSQSNGQVHQKKGIDTIQLQIRNWVNDVTEYEDQKPKFEERVLWDLDDEEDAEE